MGELYDDRRQEPRFPANGSFRFESGKLSSHSGKILDLSLNGAMLERVGGLALQRGQREQLILQFPGQPAFASEALVIHVGQDRIGIEFYDMDAQSFATLASLIDTLTNVP